MLGNCGVGIAPCKKDPQSQDVAAWDLVNLEAIPIEVLKSALTWDWQTFRQYMDAAQQRGTAVNLAFLAPLTPFGAHTKVLHRRRYPTEALVKIRDHGFFMDLETAHWHLSTAPALCAGFKGRGTLVEGAPADVVIYDLDRLALKPMEIAHDFPGGE